MKISITIPLINNKGNNITYPYDETSMKLEVKGIEDLEAKIKELLNESKGVWRDTTCYFTVDNETYGSSIGNLVNQIKNKLIKEIK